MFYAGNHTLPELTAINELALCQNDRVGRSASWQYIGAGEDKITLNGVLLPEVTGGDISLELLRTAAYRGRPYPLIEGTGMIYGMYIMDGLNEGGRSSFQTVKPSG